MDIQDIQDEIDKSNISKAFELIDEFGINTPEYHRLKQEFIAGKSDIDFHQRLKVFVQKNIGNNQTSNHIKIFKSMPYFNKLFIIAIFLSFIASLSWYFFPRWGVNSQYIDSNYKSTSLDERVTQLVGEQIGLILDEKFKNSYISQDTFYTVKNFEAVMIELKGIQENNINFTSNLYRHFGIALCYETIALTSSSAKNQTENANQSIQHSQKALKIIEYINNGDFKDKELKMEIQQWIVKYEIREYLKARILMSYCIKLVNNDPTISKEKIKLLIAELSEGNFMAKERYDQYPIFQQAQDILKK